MEKKTEVVLIKENDDGSADFMFNLPPESVAAFARLGIMTAIQAAVGEAEQLNPDLNVHASDTSQERVHKTGKRKHG